MKGVSGVAPIIFFTLSIILTIQIEERDGLPLLFSAGSKTGFFYYINNGLTGP